MNTETDFEEINEADGLSHTVMLCEQTTRGSWQAGAPFQHYVRIDVQQIEVLKGPQGALYGRNAVAGAVLVTTKAPTNEFEARVAGGIGNNDAPFRLGRLGA